MNRTLLRKVFFSTTLVAVLAMTLAPALTAMPVIQPEKCRWAGNCPVQFCSGTPSGPASGSCSEYEACTDCGRDCTVYSVNGQLCKTNCNYW